MERLQQQQSSQALSITKPTSVADLRTPPLNGPPPAIPDEPAWSLLDGLVAKGARDIGFIAHAVNLRRADRVKALIGTAQVLRLVFVRGTLVALDATACLDDRQEDRRS